MFGSLTSPTGDCESASSTGESSALGALVWLVPLIEVGRGFCCIVEARLGGFRAARPGLDRPFGGPASDGREVLREVVDAGGPIEVLPAILFRGFPGTVVFVVSLVAAGLWPGVEIPLRGVALPEDGLEPSCFVGDFVGDCKGLDIIRALQCDTYSKRP